LIKRILDISKTQKAYKNKIPKNYFLQNMQIFNQIGRARKGGKGTKSIGPI